jgi:hypothetical protein
MERARKREKKHAVCLSASSLCSGEAGFVLRGVGAVGQLIACAGYPDNELESSCLRSGGNRVLLRRR